MEGRVGALLAEIRIRRNGEMCLRQCRGLWAMDVVRQAYGQGVVEDTDAKRGRGKHDGNIQGRK